MGCGSSSAAAAIPNIDPMDIPSPYGTLLKGPPKQGDMIKVINGFREECPDSDTVNKAKFLAVLEKKFGTAGDNLFADKEVMSLFFDKLSPGGELSIRKFNLCCTLIMFDEQGGSRAKAQSLFKTFVDDTTGGATLNHRGLMDMLKETLLSVFDMADQMLGKTGSFPGGTLGKKIAEGADSTIGNMLLKSAAGSYLEKMDADDSGDISADEFAKYAIDKGSFLKTFFDWFDKIGSIVRGTRSLTQEGSLKVQGSSKVADGDYWVRLDTSPGKDQELLKFWSATTAAPPPGVAPDAEVHLGPPLKAWQMDQKREWFTQQGLPDSPDLWMKLTTREGDDMYLGAVDDATNDDWYDEICQLAEMEPPAAPKREVPDV